MDRDSNTHVNITHVWQDNESVKTKTLLTLNGSIHSKDLSRLMTLSDHDARNPTRNRTKLVPTMHGSPEMLVLKVLRYR